MGRAGPRRQHGVSFEFRSSIGSLDRKDLLGMREDRERSERFAISTTIRTTSSTQSKRFVYRRGDLGKTDVYLGQRDRRWNAASHAHSSGISRC